MISIYVLKHPDTLEVRYVGATSQTLNRRLTGHIWDAHKKRNSTRKIHWIAKLLQENKKPVIELIEVCNSSEWQQKEKYWYAYYASKVNLVNTNKGGGGVFKKNANSIARTSQAKFQPIIQYDIQGKELIEWQCIRDATQHYGLSRNSIKNCLRGRSASAGGFRWKYKNKPTIHSKRQPWPNKPTTIVMKSGTVQFPSVLAAANAYHAPVHLFHRLYCNGKIQHNDIVQALRKRKAQPGRA